MGVLVGLALLAVGMILGSILILMWMAGKMRDRAPINLALGDKKYLVSLVPVDEHLPALKILKSLLQTTEDMSKDDISKESVDIVKNVGEYKSALMDNKEAWKPDSAARARVQLT